jgi:hypothetical protein
MTMLTKVALSVAAFAVAGLLVIGGIYIGSRASPKPLAVQPAVAAFGFPRAVAHAVTS